MNFNTNKLVSAVRFGLAIGAIATAGSAAAQNADSGEKRGQNLETIVAQKLDNRCAKQFIVLGNDDPRRRVKWRDIAHSPRRRKRSGGSGRHAKSEPCLHRR